MARRKEIRILMGEEVLSPAFRERLMLAVTAVYGCRYCSFAHAREAISKGVSQEEAGVRMKISQSTLSRVLKSGREKIADAIVHGKAIKISKSN